MVLGKSLRECLKKFGFFETKPSPQCSKKQGLPPLMIKKFATIAALLALTTSFSFAKEKEAKAKQTPEEHFKALDTNGDGKLSLEEFSAGQDAEKAKEEFKTLDKDSDGSLTLEEFSAKKGGGKKKKKE